MAKKNMFEIKRNFNDIVMREMGLDIDDNDHIYNMDTETIFTFKGKFIKYTENEYQPITSNEIDMNLIENPRLMEILFCNFIDNYAKRKNIEITSFYQSAVQGSSKGFFVVTYLDGPTKETKEFKSDVFINESLRIFNLICKLNHRAHMYDTTMFDIEIPKKDGKR